MKDRDESKHGRNVDRPLTEDIDDLSCKEIARRRNCRRRWAKLHAATSIPGTRTRRKRGRRRNQDLCSLLEEAARRRPRRAEKQGRESKAIYNMPKSENQNGCNSFCARFSFVNSGYLAARNLQKHQSIHRKRHISDELWITENPILRFEEPGDGRVVIQHFSKNTVISMVLGHPNSEITCIPPS